MAVPGLALAWAGSAGVLLARVVPSGSPAGPVIALVGAGSACLVAARGRFSAAVITAVAAGLVALGLGRSGPVPGAALPQGAVVIAGTAEETVSGGLVVDVSNATAADAAGSVPATILVPMRRNEHAAAGETIQVDAAGLQLPTGRPGPHSVDAVSRLGVTAVASGARLTVVAPAPWWRQAITSVRQGTASAVHAALPEPAGALLLGVAFGWHEPLDAATRSDLQDSGLIHIVAVSGLKVVIVAALLRTLLHPLPVGPGWLGAMVLCGVAAFVVLSGAGPAAVRSGLTASAAFALGGDLRRPRPFVVLGLCSSLMLLLAPRLLGDVGFQLSVLGTAGILLLAGRLSARLPGPRALIEPFSVTVAAQLATVPVMASTFGSLSLVGPVANAVVLPLLPLIIVLGWAAAPLVPLLPWAAAPVLQVAAAGCDAIVLVARGLAALPGAALHIGRWPAEWTVIEVGALSVAVIAGLISERPDE